MAWSASTSQTLVEAVREAAIKFELAVELYMQVNSPGLLTGANTAATALAAAITAVQA